MVAPYAAREAASMSENTAAQARTTLVRMTALRLDLVEAGATADEATMAALAGDIAEQHATYEVLALTEIATFRAQLHGPLEG